MLQAHEAEALLTPKPLDDDALDKMLDVAARDCVVNLRAREFTVEVPRHSIARAERMAHGAGWRTSVTVTRSGDPSTLDILHCSLPTRSVRDLPAR